MRTLTTRVGLVLVSGGAALTCQYGLLALISRLASPWSADSPPVLSHQVAPDVLTVSMLVWLVGLAWFAVGVVALAAVAPLARSARVLAVAVAVIAVEIRAHSRLVDILAPTGSLTSAASWSAALLLAPAVGALLAWTLCGQQARRAGGARTHDPRIMSPLL